MYKFNTEQQPPVLEGHLKMGGSGIEVNSRYFIKNGKPFIPVMGEMHFSRINPEEWERELEKMKSGGINVVSTYMFWIYHEEIEGDVHFDNGLDINKFVGICKKIGIDVILRIGPWAHGECRNGGFPDWLMKKPFKLRNDNDDYLALVKKWYKAVYNEVKDFMYKDGGPIIGIQLENEFVSDAQHLLTLKKIAIETGFDVPLYTVTGWNSAKGADIPEDEVLPVFGGYPEAPWTAHTKKLEPSVHYFFNPMRNDSAIGADLIGEIHEGGMRYERYPFATCELGGGIQVTHHRRPLIKPMDVYVPALTKLGSGNNLPGYYMYHGGTNQIGKLSTFNESKATGYPNDYTIIGYDFQAALGEYGIIRPQYRLFRLLHMFVNDFGDILAPMDAYMSENFVDRYDLKSLRYSMRTDGESGFVFVNHYQRLDMLEKCENVRFEINGDVFPENGIDVDGEQAFILPFNFKLADGVLKYATCQLLCKQDDTYFFMALDGINPEFKFENGETVTADIGMENSFTACGAKFVVLSKEQALYMQKHDGKVYIGDECDIYFMDGQPTADKAEFEYHVYNGVEFITEKCVNKSVKLTASVKYNRIEKPDFNNEYFYELDMIHERTKQWYNIEVSGEGGFVCIDYVGDAAQIYADGKLIADDYYYGAKWLIPVKLLSGKKITLGISELDDNVYLEVAVDAHLALKSICITE